MFSDFCHADFRARVPCKHGRTSVCPRRTEAAMPLSVSVRDGHVSVSADFARLADSSTARIRPPCWLPAVLGTPSNAEVSERPAAAEVAPGGFRCSARAGQTPAIISRACCAFVRLITATCVPRRAQAAFDVHEQPIPRAGRALQERRHVEVSARSRRWVGWGGWESARIPMGAVRSSRDAREFARNNSPISPK